MSSLRDEEPRTWQGCGNWSHPTWAQAAARTGGRPEVAPRRARGRRRRHAREAGRRWRRGAHVGRRRRHAREAGRRWRRGAHVRRRRRTWARMAIGRALGACPRLTRRAGRLARSIRHERSLCTTPRAARPRARGPPRKASGPAGGGSTHDRRAASTASLRSRVAPERAHPRGTPRAMAAARLLASTAARVLAREHHRGRSRGCCYRGGGGGGAAGRRARRTVSGQRTGRRSASSGQAAASASRNASNRPLPSTSTRREVADQLET